MPSRDDTLVLCYHALSERWPADLNVTPDAFERQIDLLVQRGYRAVTFSEAVHGDHSGKRVAVTFDDAYRSVVERGRSMLGARGFVATVFVVTACANGERRIQWPGIDQWSVEQYGEDLAPASWQELGSLADAGWEIGSHSNTHPRLTELSDWALALELAESKDHCESRLQRPCNSLAYPFGAVDERVRRAAAEAGYRSGAALPERFERVEPLLWPRVGVYHGDDLRRFKLKISPSVRRLRASRAWSLTSLRPRVRRRRARRESAADQTYSR